jgi:molybdopterin synthase sulfur carrier subunit
MPVVAKPWEDSAMSVEVRIPTILRTYTGGEKAVSAEGASLADVIADLDANHPGIGERLLDESGLRRFVNIYVNDEDVRFLDGLGTVIADRDSITILPAVAGG